MADPTKIEDAPNYLKTLEEYGKTAITLSLALISVSAAYAGQSLRPSAELSLLLPLGGLWLCLFLALLAGLLVIAQVTGASSNYIRAYRIAYPDPLQTLSQHGTLITAATPPTTISLSDPEKKDLKAALERATKRAISANSWSNFSLWMFGASALLIIYLGIYSAVSQNSVDASTAVNTSTQFVTQAYHLNSADTLFSSLTYDSTRKIYTIEIKNAQNPNDSYHVTIDALSGKVTNVQKTP